MEALRARSAAVARVALSRVLSHLRRGRCSELWDALIHEAETRLETLKGAVKRQQQQQQQLQSGRSVEAKADAAAVEPTSETPRRRGRPAKGVAKKGDSGGGGGPAEAVAVVPVSSSHHSDEDGEVASAQRSLARAIALVAQAVHYFRCGTAQHQCLP